MDQTFDRERLDLERAGRSAPLPRAEPPPGAETWPTPERDRAGATRAPGVLMIVENLPVPFDRRVWNEARALVAAGYEVSVICPTGKGYEARYEELGGVRIYRHRMPPEAHGRLAYPIEYAAALAFEAWLSLRILFRHGFDIVHACNPPDTIFLIGGFYRLLGKKFIFDHHDLSPELYEAKFGRRDVIHSLLLKLEKWTFKTAHAVIATNCSYRDVAIERGGVDPDQVFVVRSGPDLKRVRRLPPNGDVKAGRSYLVGYVGVIGQQEGLGYLMEAVAHIVHDRGRDDVHFVVVGDGTELGSVKADAEARGIDAYVTFTGRIDDAAMLEALSTADVCVNPDEVNEMNDKSTMNKIMEYMALGKPIVQFDMTEGRRSAKDASLYAAPNDPKDFASKILALLEDPARRERMGAFGRQRVRDNLAWQHEAPKLLQAYRSVLGDPAREEEGERVQVGRRAKLPAA